MESFKDMPVGARAIVLKVGAAYQMFDFSTYLTWLRGERDFDSGNVLRTPLGSKGDDGNSVLSTTSFAVFCKNESGWTKTQVKLELAGNTLSFRLGDGSYATVTLGEKLLLVDRSKEGPDKVTLSLANRIHF